MSAQPPPVSTQAPSMESLEEGEEVPMPTLPFVLIIKAGIELVAYLSDEVAIQNEPPWEDNVQVFKSAPANSSVIPIYAFVVVVAEFETVNFHAGVVVPMPTVVVLIEPEPAFSE